MPRSRSPAICATERPSSRSTSSVSRPWDGAARRSPTGRPVAASGARMLTTMIYELRRTGGGIGVAAMCAGGGQGGAVVIEVPAG